MPSRLASDRDQDLADFDDRFSAAAALDEFLIDTNILIKEALGRSPDDELQISFLKQIKDDNGSVGEPKTKASDAYDLLAEAIESVEPEWRDV